MNKENTKTVNVSISTECWRELNILRYRKNYLNLQEVIRDILQTYTNKIINKENSNS
jgi:hypothetical protein